MTQNHLLAALDFYADAGVSAPVFDAPQNRYTAIEDSFASLTQSQKIQPEKKNKSAPTKNLSIHADIVKKAENLASSAKNLDELKQVIQNFDDLSIKKTATQIVFGDGLATAKIMIIGETPGADDDRAGVPFSGPIGDLCNKILGSINLSREAVYLTNILNWRPPGNRTPTAEEIALSKPFVEKHIALIAPDILIFMGGLGAQTLLNKDESVSRMRGKIHTYDCEGKIMKAIVTYHPDALIKTPLQKRKVWEDMLMIQNVINENIATE